MTRADQEELRVARLRILDLERQVAELRAERRRLVAPHERPELMPNGHQLKELQGIAIGTIALLSPHIQAGSLRPLAVTAATRAKQLPDVPTIAELGVARFEAQSWCGLLAPAKTAPDVVARMNAVMAKALADPRVKQSLTEQGVDYVLSSPDEFGQFIASEVARWAKVIKANNIVGE